MVEVKVGGSEGNERGKARRKEERRSGKEEEI